MADAWQKDLPQGPLPDRSPHVIAAAIVALFFSTIAVLLRCISRKLSKASFWWDDWIIIISLPFTWAPVGLTLGWVSVGLGKHIWSPGVRPETGMKLLLAIECVYDISITLIRLSVVLFYYRIFGKDRWFKIALWITSAILIAWFIALTVLAIFQCSPVARQWDYSIPGHCFSLYGTFVGVTISNVFVDVLLLVLPLPMLWKLQIKLKKKIALIANFMLGYSVIIVTIIRLLSIIRVPDDAVQDVSWNSTTPDILFMVEPAVATVSICLPSLWSLCVLRFKRFRTEYIRGRWSNRSSTFHRRTRRNANYSKSGDRAATHGYPEKAHTYPVNQRRTAEDKDPFVDVDETSRSFSPVTPFDKEPFERVRSPEKSKSMEVEDRVRQYYNHSAFGSRSQEALQEEESWSRSDLESGRSPERENPVPVPPKEKYPVLIS